MSGREGVFRLPQLPRVPLAAGVSMPCLAIGIVRQGSGVPKEDAARLASLAFLRQYASRAILEEEAPFGLRPFSNVAAAIGPPARCPQLGAGVFFVFFRTFLLVQ